MKVSKFRPEGQFEIITFSAQLADAAFSVNDVVMVSNSNSAQGTVSIVPFGGSKKLETLGIVVGRETVSGAFYLQVKMFFPPENLSQQDVYRALSNKIGTWYVTKLNTLTTTFRQYLVLVKCKEFPLFPLLTAPEHTSGTPAEDFPIHLPPKLKTHIASSFNDSQLRAIKAAVKGAGCGEESPSFTLLQGPPGTGKTHCILGVINVILNSYSHVFEEYVSKLSKDNASISNEDFLAIPKPHILVCAPSNVAVDHIATQILEKGLLDGDLQRFSPTIVRFGDTSSSSQIVKESSLDQQITALLKLSDEEFEKEFKEVESKLVGLDGKLALHQFRLQLTMRKYQIARELRNATGMARRSLHDYLQLALLHEADVVLCTLAGSGIQTLHSAGFKFDCVIVDEATQSVEVANLCPLQYGCKRCVLVGDPKQLPATIISQKAKEFNFEQSLFERLQKLGHDVFMLDTQYRMHPSISRFPSSHFYNGALADSPLLQSGARELNLHRSKFLGPCVFFDLTNSKETLSRQSYVNEMEAAMAVGLLKKLLEQHTALLPNGIGVITPYKAQAKLLKQKIIAEFGPSITDNVDINTVDAFQGHENDVVIFSSVRSSKGSGSIGFVGDVRRMNVGLTRARYCLWVLGNSQTLVRNQDWKAFVKSVRADALYVKVPNVATFLSNFPPLPPPPDVTSTNPDAVASVNGSATKTDDVASVNPSTNSHAPNVDAYTNPDAVASLSPNGTNTVSSTNGDSTVTNDEITTNGVATTPSLDAEAAGSADQTTAQGGDVQLNSKRSADEQTAPSDDATTKRMRV